MSELKEVGAEVSLWGQSQEELEELALQELQIFSDENKKSKKASVANSKASAFNLTDYLQNQEDLRRKQECTRKQQQVNTKSAFNKELADLKKPAKRKMLKKTKGVKRKKSEVQKIDSEAVQAESGKYFFCLLIIV